MKIALYRNEKDRKVIVKPQPFVATITSWVFDKDDEYAEIPYFNGTNYGGTYFDGFVVTSEAGVELHESVFPAAPFVIPPGGGTIAIDCSSLREFDVQNR